MQTASDDCAILIAMEPGFYNKAEYSSANCTTTAGGDPSKLCHYCFDDGAAATTPDSVEYGYFDLLHKQVENDFCVDTDGSSSRATPAAAGWRTSWVPVPRRAARAGERHGRPAACHPRRHQDLRRSPDRGVPDSRLPDASNVYSGSVAALERLLAAQQVPGGTPMRDGADRAPTRSPASPTTPTSTAFATPAARPNYPIVFCTSRGKTPRRPDHLRRPRLLGVLRGCCSARSSRTARDEGEHAGFDQDVAVARRLGRAREQPARQRAFQAFVAEAQAPVADRLLVVGGGAADRRRDESRTARRRSPRSRSWSPAGSADNGPSERAGARRAGGPAATARRLADVSAWPACGAGRRCPRSP